MAIANASFVVYSKHLFVRDGVNFNQLDFKLTERTGVLSQALRCASSTGATRLPTNFSTEQIHLWATYARSPRLFRTQADILGIIATIEVADMLSDDKAVSELCRHLTTGYLDPLRPTSHCTPCTSHNAPKRPARCRPPPPRLTCRQALLWGAAPAAAAELQAVMPPALQPCCRAQTKLSSRAASQTPGQAALISKALQLLPEHLLLRVLRAWEATLGTQLLTLPCRHHPAVLSAAHPSVEAQRTLRLPALNPVPFRRAIRATAKLASLRGLSEVTLEAPSACCVAKHDKECACDVCIQKWRGGYHPHGSPPTAHLHRPDAALQFVVRHLGRAPALTSLNLADAPHDWLRKGSKTDLSGMACIAGMPYVRAVGVEAVKPSLLRTLLPALAPMTQLQELHLGLTAEILPLSSPEAGCRLAERVHEICGALPVLRVLRLKAEYWHVGGGEKNGECARQRLLGLKNMRVSFDDSLRYEGRRPMGSVLGTACAAAQQLDIAESWVDETGFVELRFAAVVQAVWGALTGGGVPCVAMEGLRAGWGIEGVRMHHGGSGIAIPPALLAALPGPQQLRMHYGDMLDRSSATALARSMHVLTSVTCLDLAETALGAFEGKILLPRLSLLTALADLNVGRNCMGSEGGVTLTAALRPLEMLTRLDLSENDLGERGVSAVMAALPNAAAARLGTLELGWNLLGPQGVAAVARRLPDMRALEELGLDANIAGAEGAAAVADGLLACAGLKLKDLYFSRNFLECGGAVAFARCLPRLRQLTQLTLTSNAIGVVGARAIARRVARMPSLTTLSVDFNCIGDTGGTAFVQCLNRAEGLEWLGMQGCQIGDAGVIALAEAVLTGGRTRKLSLDLYNNNVSAKVWYAISARQARALRRGVTHFLCNGHHRAEDEGILCRGSIASWHNTKSESAAEGILCRGSIASWHNTKSEAAAEGILCRGSIASWHNTKSESAAEGILCRGSIASWHNTKSEAAAEGILCRGSIASWHNTKSESAAEGILCRGSIASWHNTKSDSAAEGILCRGSIASWHTAAVLGCTGSLTAAGSTCGL
eukprot:jgi/Ulvmu1/8656/UM046_0061.1